MKPTSRLGVTILTIFLTALAEADQPGLVIYNMGNGSMALVAGHCAPLTPVVLEMTTDLTNWTAISTNTATLNYGTVFYVSQTNSLAFFRVLERFLFR
jgi:hypothetical protein